MAGNREPKAGLIAFRACAGVSIEPGGGEGDGASVRSNHDMAGASRMNDRWRSERLAKRLNVRFCIAVERYFQGVGRLLD